MQFFFVVILVLLLSDIHCRAIVQYSGPQRSLQVENNEDSNGELNRYVLIPAANLERYKLASSEDFSNPEQYTPNDRKMYRDSIAKKLSDGFDDYHLLQQKDFSYKNKGQPQDNNALSWEKDPVLYSSKTVVKSDTSSNVDHHHDNKEAVTEVASKLETVDPRIKEVEKEIADIINLKLPTHSASNQDADAKASAESNETSLVMLEVVNSANNNVTNAKVLAKAPLHETESELIPASNEEEKILTEMLGTDIPQIEHIALNVPHSGAEVVKVIKSDVIQTEDKQTAGEVKNGEINTAQANGKHELGLDDEFKETAVKITDISQEGSPQNFSYEIAAENGNINLVKKPVKIVEIDLAVTLPPTIPTIYDYAATHKKVTSVILIIVISIIGLVFLCILIGSLRNSFCRRRTYSDKGMVLKPSSSAGTMISQMEKDQSPLVFDSPLNKQTGPAYIPSKISPVKSAGTSTPMSQLTLPSEKYPATKPTASSNSLAQLIKVLLQVDKPLDSSNLKQKYSSANHRTKLKNFILT